MVNIARDNQYARLQVQRRWLLQDRLGLSRLNFSAEQFRSLGSVELRGVLHVAYQTTIGINGGYALCALLDEHFLVAFQKPTLVSSKLSHWSSCLMSRLNQPRMEK